MRRFDFEFYLFEMCLTNLARCLLFSRFDLKLNTAPFYFDDWGWLLDEVDRQQGLEPVKWKPIQTLIDLSLFLFLVHLHVEKNAFHH